MRPSLPWRTLSPADAVSLTVPEAVEADRDVENVLQLDWPAHHPQHHPDDKNFNHYREQVGTGIELTGFYGSPNLKHSAPVNDCAFSPDGKLFLSASYDNTLRLWDTQSGTLLHSIQLPWSPLYAVFHPRLPGQVICANANGTVTAFDVRKWMP